MGPETQRPADGLYPPTGQGVHDVAHRNPRRKVPKRPLPDNLATRLLVRRLYEALVELEALAIMADEAVTSLPAGPTGRYKRTLARLYSLVGQTAGRATAVLELGEELVDLHKAKA